SPCPGRVARSRSPRADAARWPRCGSAEESMTPDHFSAGSAPGLRSPSRDVLADGAERARAHDVMPAAVVPARVAGGWGTQPPQDGGRGTRPPYRPRTAATSGACEAGEVTLTT